jgi:K+-transporting ATPase ATPase C chain
MRRQLLPALRMMVVFTVVLGLGYPVVTLAAAQLGFKHQADGSLVTRNGQVVGSSLLGQTFTSDKYFQGRPSAAGITASGSTDASGQAGDGSDLSLSSSGGSNLGPTNSTLLDGVADDPSTPDVDESSPGVAQRVQAYRQANGLSTDQPVPVDAVTSSGSGVDPQISVANARLQANRVAKARGIDVSVVNQLIDQHTQGRSLGFLGEEGVNVLQLNLALDQQP